MIGIGYTEREERRRAIIQVMGTRRERVAVRW